MYVCTCAQSNFSIYDLSMKIKKFSESDSNNASTLLKKIN